MFFLCLHKTDRYSLCSQNTHLGGSCFINAFPKIDADTKFHLCDFVMHSVCSMTRMVKGQCSDLQFVFLRCEAKTHNTTIGNERRCGLQFVFLDVFVSHAWWNLEARNRQPVRTVKGHSIHLLSATSKVD